MIRSYLPGVAAMAIIVVASNILVQFLLGQWLTWGAFTYPFTFLIRPEDARDWNLQSGPEE